MTYTITLTRDASITIDAEGYILEQVNIALPSAIRRRIVFFEPKRRSTDDRVAGRVALATALADPRSTVGLRPIVDLGGHDLCEVDAEIITFRDDGLAAA